MPNREQKNKCFFMIMSFRLEQGEVLVCLSEPQSLDCGSDNVSRKRTQNIELIRRVPGRKHYPSKRVGAISGARPSIGGRKNQRLVFLLIRRRGQIGRKICTPQKNRKNAGRIGYARYYSVTNPNRRKISLPWRERMKSVKRSQ